MATHDYVIDDQTTPQFRSDLNNALSAIVSNNSSATEPADTFANMWWVDTANNYLKIRDENDAAWIIVAEMDVTNSRIKHITNSITAATAAGIDIFNSSGTKIIDLQVASQATAEAGTNNTELMTPLRSKQLVDQEIGNIAGNQAFMGSIGTNVASGLTERTSVNITPTSTSSKILVLASMYDQQNNSSVEIELQRDSTVLVGSRRSSNFREIRGDGTSLSALDSMSTFWLDEPNTTSQINYKLMSDVTCDNANIIAIEISS
jgi:hypothetical protein